VLSVSHASIINIDPVTGRSIHTSDTIISRTTDNHLHTVKDGLSRSRASHTGCLMVTAVVSLNILAAIPPVAVAWTATVISPWLAIVLQVTPTP
jgi:hypothetical protein